MPQEFIFILWRCPFLFWEFITVVQLCSVRWRFQGVHEGVIGGDLVKY